MTPTQHSDEYPMVPSDRDPQFADELLIGELTAALAAEAASADDELPPALAQLATLSGESLLRAARLDRDTAAVSRAPYTDSAPIAVAAPAGTPVTPLRTVTVWSGWMAAAAMLAFMVLGGGAQSGVESGENGSVAQAAQLPGSVSGDSPSVLAAALQDSLLANDAALLRGSFAGTDDPAGAGASGEVLWSATAQRGVMRLVGLQPNDRARLQYQLWIFDKARDQRYPVDGGVFDIPAGATEVMVPIDARLPVQEAAMFAVTVEPAGGVVVSSRERIALLAEL